MLAPQQRETAAVNRSHSRITTDVPRVRWGAEATLAWTWIAGREWFFILVDHYGDEAWWYVANIG